MHFHRHHSVFGIILTFNVISLVLLIIQCISHMPVNHFHSLHFHYPSLITSLKTPVPRILDADATRQLL